MQLSDSKAVAFKYTYSIPTVLGASTENVAFEYRGTVGGQASLGVVQKAFRQVLGMATLPLYARAGLGFRIAWPYAIASYQVRYIRARHPFSIPHQITVVELPIWSRLVINIIENPDNWCVRLIVQCVLSNHRLENDPSAWQVTKFFWEGVHVVLEGMWHVFGQKMDGHGLQDRMAHVTPGYELIPVIGMCTGKKTCVVG
jgi:hypothetical protein